MSAHQRTLTVYELGPVEYEDGLALQKAFALARKGRSIRDSLILLEHPPVITLGRGASEGNIRLPPDQLAALGIRVFRTDRGGDVTYHGPGQVVGYPVIDLSPDRCDVRRFVRDVEEAMIQAAADFGVTAGRIEGWTGVWLGAKGKDARKLGAIGLHISRWVTTHGFAFNVSPNLSHFETIVPCGIPEAGVTSLKAERGVAPPLPEAGQAVARHLAERMGAEVRPGRLDHRTVSVAVLRRGSSGLEALLLKRHPHRGGFWQPVTGTIEPGEQPLACARRELGEETGLEAEVSGLDYVHSFLFGEPRPDRPPRIFQETAFYALASQGGQVRLDSREHSEYAWLPAEAALDRVPFAGLKEALRRAIRAVQAAGSTQSA